MGVASVASQLLWRGDWRRALIQGGAWGGALLSIKEVKLDREINRNTAAGVWCFQEGAVLFSKASCFTVNLLQVDDSSEGVKANTVAQGLDFSPIYFFYIYCSV